MKDFYQIRAAIDPSIIGRSEAPISVQIKDRWIYDLSRKYSINIQKYFDDKKDLVALLPDKVTGKIFQKNKKPIDFMKVIPFVVGLQYIVSEKVKTVFDALKIEGNQYQFKKMNISGTEDIYYFLMIPIEKDSSAINYSRSIFYDKILETNIVFESFENYKRESIGRNLLVKQIVLNERFENHDIINLQCAGPFFSSRIMDAFIQNKVLGYRVIEKGELFTKIVIA